MLEQELRNKPRTFLRLPPFSEELLQQRLPADIPIYTPAFTLGPEMELSRSCSAVTPVNSWQRTHPTPPNTPSPPPPTPCELWQFAMEEIAGAEEAG